MAGKQNPLVQEALALLKLKPGVSIYEAAKITGANAQSVYSAARRLRGREGDDMPVCPTCGGLLKPGQVLKAEPVALSTAYRAIDQHLRTIGPAAKKNVAQSLRNLIAVAEGR